MKYLVVAVVAAALATAACGEEPRGKTSRIAFFSTADSNYRLPTANSDGQGIRVIAGESIRGSVTPHLFTRPSWSPDGRQIAFAGVASGDPAGFRADVYTMGADGSRQRRLTKTRDAFGPVWSPDGRTIVFTRLRGPLSGSLWAMRPDGSERERLTQDSRGRTDLAGSFSPDGSELVFTQSTCAGRRGCLSMRSALVTVRRDGSRERKLLDRAGEPAFSPDGRRIAFVSDRDENGSLSYGDRTTFASELYVMGVDGSSQRRLTWTRDLNEAAPSWSPDGSRLAFQRGRVIDNAEGTSLLEMNADGTCEREILADPRLDTWYASPAWRPGGRAGGAPLEC
jgi:Tol biopolymer transport system component